MSEIYFQLSPPRLPLFVCQEVADNQIDTGDLMDCLVQNKHQKEMTEKCAVGVTHFQLVSRLMKMCSHNVFSITISACSNESAVTIY